MMPQVIDPSTHWLGAMPRFGLKALFAVLMVNRSKKPRLDRDTFMLIFAVLLTLGLVILYLLTKIVSW